MVLEALDDASDGCVEVGVGNLGPRHTACRGIVVKTLWLSRHGMRLGDEDGGTGLDKASLELPASNRAGGAADESSDRGGFGKRAGLRKK